MEEAIPGRVVGQDHVVSACNMHCLFTVCLAGHHQDAAIYLLWLSMFLRWKPILDCAH